MSRPTAATLRSPNRAAEVSVQLRVELGSDKKPPTEFIIFRKGENPSEKGTFIFDDEAAASVMEEFAAHGKTLRIDYNHGTTFRNPTPEMAITAGSFTPAIRNGSLWATDVKWTSRAEAYLTAGEYTEVSPLFNHVDGHVTWVRNVALTNLPALDHTTPLVAANANGDTMACEACSSKDRQITDLTTRCTSLSTEVETLRSKVPSAEDSAMSANLRSEVVALTGATAIPTAIGTLRGLRDKAARADELEVKLNAINTERWDAAYKAAIEGAVTAKKITPAQRTSFWDVRCMKDGHATEAGIEMLSGYLGVAVALTAAPATQSDPGGEVLITPEDRRVAEQLGNKIDDVIAFKKTQLLNGATI